jgi:hypothetical protein
MWIKVHHPHPLSRPQYGLPRQQDGLVADIAVCKPLHRHDTKTEQKNVAPAPKKKSKYRPFKVSEYKLSEEIVKYRVCFNSNKLKSLYYIIQTTGIVIYKIIRFD